MINQGGGKRKYMQEKQALHNAFISIPFFISQTPTKIIAINNIIPNHRIEPSQIQHKLHFQQHKFIKTKILFFQTLEHAIVYHGYYTDFIKQNKLPKNWIQYCFDISGLESMLYFYGKMYVANLQSKQIKGLINEVSQSTVVNGTMFEQTLKKMNNAMFRFLDHNVLSLEYIYYRWRTYAYLQGDGDKKYNNETFRMLVDGVEWFPPYPIISIPRGILSYTKRKYFSKYLWSLSRKKPQIEQGMVFAIHNIHCAVDIAIMITLQILQKLTEDFIKYFYLISDILFNTTAEHYRKLFARIIPFIIYKYSKISIRDDESSNNSKQSKSLKPSQNTIKTLQSKHRSQLKSLINIWEQKFIFDQCYIKGLLYVLNRNDRKDQREIKGIHNNLRDIGSIENDDESEFQLQKLCFSNGIPFIENEKQQSTSLINQYLWLFTKDEEKMPQSNGDYDGQTLTEKDMLKIKNKQVKVICSQNLPLSILLQKNWQTKHKGRQSASVDNE